MSFLEMLKLPGVVVILAVPFSLILCGIFNSVKLTNLILSSCLIFIISYLYRIIILGV